MKKILSVFVFFVVMFSTNGIATPEGCPAGSTNSASVDHWANAVSSTSGNIDFSSRALGANNGQYATIHSTSPDSYIVLDMGAGEEVWDQFGVDFRVYNDNSNEYWVDVYVSNNPTTGFQYAGSTNGNGQDDLYLGGTSYSSVRYIKIVNSDHDSNVEIDAVKGYCITSPRNDVPEFGVVAAGVALAGAGFVIARKRK